MILVHVGMTLLLLTIPAAKVEKPAEAAPERRVAPQRPSRGAQRTRPNLESQRANPSPDDAFWRRLADCENPRGDHPAGYFQFTDPGTARKAGYVRGSSYEEQRAAAKRWLAMIGGRGGSRAGWPTCWWRAL